MTHRLYFVIRHKDFDKFEELKDNILSDEDFLSAFNLKKDREERNWIRIARIGEVQPFFWFPEKEDIDDYEDDKENWKGYELNIETGSHVSEEDTPYAVQWFYFTLAFKFCFKEELRDFEMFYHFEGDDEELTEDEMRKEIFGGGKE